MSKVQHTAALHPATVRAIAADSPARRRRPRGKDKKPRPAPVAKVTVRPDVWKMATKLAQGDQRRIQIISETEVLVHNGVWR